MAPSFPPRMTLRHLLPISVIVMTIVLELHVTDCFFWSTRSKLQDYRSILNGNYGNWCGKKNTWLIHRNEEGCCSCDDPVSVCRKCKPPVDELDEACLKHDHCVHCNRTGIKFQHFCECEKLLTDLASWSYCAEGAVSACGVYRTAVTGLFKRIPCICRDPKQCYIPIPGKRIYIGAPCPKLRYKYCIP